VSEKKARLREKNPWVSEKKTFLREKKPKLNLVEHINVVEQFSA